MIYSAGDCPVCSDSGAMLFVIGISGGRVITYCPACGCAWASPADATKASKSRGPEEFGVRQMRAATIKEITKAGLDNLVRAEHGDNDFVLP